MSDSNGRQQSKARRLAPFGYGLGALALLAAVSLVWVTLLPEPPRIPERQQGEQIDTNYKTGGGPCEPKRLAAIAHATARADKAAECAREAENYRIEKEALKQAIRVTDATEEGLRVGHSQAQIAFIQAVFSTLAVAFTGWAAWEAGRAARAALASVEDARSDAEEQATRFAAQLDLAQKAAAASAASAVAMGRVADAMATNVEKITETIEINREIGTRQKLLGEAQLRAYVSVLVGGAFYQDDNYVFEADPVLQNVGGTPAHNVRWRIAADILPVPLPEGFRFPLPPRDRTSSRSLLLPPQQTFELRASVGRRINSDEVLPTKLGFGHSLYVWGVVTYRDIFRRRHRTTFAQQMFWRPSGPAGPDGRIPEIVRGSYLPHHNKAN